jgi:hypothetical protein
VQEECAAEAAEPVEEVPAKWVSPKLESWSDFDFSFAFDNNNSKRLCGAQIIYTFSFFLFFSFCVGAVTKFYGKNTLKKINFFLPGAPAPGSPLCVFATGLRGPYLHWIWEDWV